MVNACTVKNKYPELTGCDHVRLTAFVIARSNVSCVHVKWELNHDKYTKETEVEATTAIC